MNTLMVLLDGLKAMVLGMGMVYVFLIVMICCMKAMSKALAPFANALVKAQPVKKSAAPKASSSKELSPADKILAQAAIAAVKMHRGGK